MKLSVSMDFIESDHVALWIMYRACNQISLVRIRLRRLFIFTELKFRNSCTQNCIYFSYLTNIHFSCIKLFRFLLFWETIVSYMYSESSLPYSVLLFWTDAALSISKHLFSPTYKARNLLIGIVIQFTQNWKVS